jgi:TRAP-type uncharacterized transport system substrate-binding protein
MWRFFRIHKDRVILLAAVGLTVCAGLAALSYWYYVSPTRLTVAVGPRDGPEARLITAYAEALAERKRYIRLRIVPVDDVKSSAEELQQGKVDLAVVRPDVLLPTNGATVAILREEALVVVAPAASKIADLAGLEKKRLGIVSHHDADLPVIGSVLRQYDLASPNLTLVPLDKGMVAEAFASKRIDALAFLAVPVSAEAAEIMRAVTAAAQGKVTVIPIEEGEALALGSPVLSAASIPVGSFGGRPKLPGEDVKTVAVSYRLMARTDLDRVVVSKVAQYLFQMRSRIAHAAPAANLMKAPETETSTSATLPNHQGAIDYFNREQLTFMDRYGDWLWLALFASGGIGSGLAWVSQLFARRRRELLDKVVDRVLCILGEARAAKTPTELDKLAVELDGLVTHAVRHARRRTTGARVMSALIMAIDTARVAIADRRRDLAAEEQPRAAKEAAPRLASSGRSGKA